MHGTPGVWPTIDLSDQRCCDIDTTSLVTFFRQPFVWRDCRNLILDRLSCNNKFLHQVLTREMPNISSICIVSFPNINGDELIKLINYILRPSTPRPVQLQSLALLGAPLFPLDQPSVLAPILVAAADLEIITDLEQCLGKNHIVTDRVERKWDIKGKFPCTVCRRAQEVWNQCHVEKSYLRCRRFYCDECELYPNVCSSPFNATLTCLSTSTDFIDSAQVGRVGVL
jgi:hypothetical protein